MEHTEGFLKLVNAIKPNIREISVSEARKRISADPKVRLIDVREDHEWDAEHARGSLHLGKGVIERDVERTIPDQTTEIILYCGGGYRSALAADALQKMGYSNVLSLAGGWKAWVESGAPTEK